jgi:flagellar biosynthesis/type III secretory pathway protein FliH
MTGPKRPPRGGGWRGNPLLSAPVPAAPGFERADWDEPRARPFGPWRVVPAISPLDAVHEIPPPGAPQVSPAAEPPAPRGAKRSATADPPALAGPPLKSEVAPAAESPEQVAAREEALRAAIAQAHARGVAEGEAAARRELAQAGAGHDALLREIASALQALAVDPDRCFEPLRRLALHLAEQLVRAELRLSGAAIEQLVRLSLEQLPGPVLAPTVSLNPEDLALLGESGAIFGPDCRLEADPMLARGSVRAAARDAIVEDFIEHRLAALADRLLADPQAWHSRASPPTDGSPPEAS